MTSQSDRLNFQSKLSSSRKITILTGAGVSAESGIATFRGAGGFWRRYQAQDLASPEAWERDPGLVWEFYNYRRSASRDAVPNPAHRAIAMLEARWRNAGGTFTVLTQNIDDLHEQAGSQSVVHLHGSIWHVRCLACGEVEPNRNIPITAAYEGSGSPDPEARSRRFTEADLPHCHCGGLQRPHVVWFGEMLESKNLIAAANAIDECNLLLVVGTSAVVHPAAGFVDVAKQFGTTIAEANIEASAVNDLCDYFFEGKAGEMLPSLLDVEPTWG
ncbi:MAG: NAD-dependent deacylase [Polyangiaceae bacterium]|nr:NAD-dependent deacylase [Polyangiaceae bacterium]